ncbi:MAG: acyl-CoA carboxylase epsilon subunit [Nostocoides sp.]
MSPSPAPESEASGHRPMLKVISGQATPEEIAAIVAVLAAAGGGSEARGRHTVSPWSDPARLLRGSMTPGPDGWSRSALPC